MNSLKTILFSILTTLALLAGFVACEKGGDDVGSGGAKVFITDITPRSSVLTSIGANVTIQAKGALTTDVVELVDGGKTLEAVINRATETTFRFTVPEGVVSGTTYELWVRRDDMRQKLFEVTLSIQSVDTNVPDKPGMNIKGMVYCGSKGVKGVCVTDGVDITVTDDNGHYWLKSDKRFGSAYIILPVGYEVPAVNALPQYWRPVTPGSEGVDQCDFELIKVDNTNNTVLVATDIHLSNREQFPNNLVQFRQSFVKELQDLYTGVPNVYCLNLGDFAFDIYWYQYSCGPQEVANQVSDLPCQFWSTMGNHDNDGHTGADGEWADNLTFMSTEYLDKDLASSAKYRSVFGSTHVAMNLGQVHYILVDDIFYRNDYGSIRKDKDPKMGDRNYDAGIRPDIIEWIRKDLSYVPKSTPIVVGMHIPVASWNGAYINYKDAANWNEFIDLFEGYDEVDFISGHTHVNRMHSIPGRSKKMYEHNIGAVCGIWWNNSEFTGGTKTQSGKLMLCSDGSPTCYYVYNVNGLKRKWHLKGIGVAENKQFKSYDMNEVKKFYDNWPIAKKFMDTGTCTVTNDGVESTITWTKADYGGSEPDNTVFINVWGYENGDFASYGNWSITVTEKETGKTLDVRERIYTHDFLSAICYEMPQFNNSGKLSSSSRSTGSLPHMFQVQASEYNTTLEIRVKDRFGNVYYEEMKRPKAVWDGKNIETAWTYE